MDSYSESSSIFETESISYTTSASIIDTESVTYDSQSYDSSSDNYYGSQSEYENYSDDGSIEYHNLPEESDSEEPEIFLNFNTFVHETESDTSGEIITPGDGSEYEMLEAIHELGPYDGDFKLKIYGNGEKFDSDVQYYDINVLPPENDVSIVDDVPEVGQLNYIYKVDVQEVEPDKSNESTDQSEKGQLVNGDTSDLRNSQHDVGCQDLFKQSQDLITEMVEQRREMNQKLNDVIRMLEHLMMPASENQNEITRDECTNTKYFH